jgi:hypothetical protein
MMMSIMSSLGMNWDILAMTFFKHESKPEMLHINASDGREAYE